MSREKVQLALYDLSGGLAAQMSAALLQGKQIPMIPHTGVIVFGLEYFFGGGIQAMPHEAVARSMAPVQILDLGETEVDRDTFQCYLESISSRYTAATYDLFQHNCNNFSNEVAQFLTGQSIPEWITELPMEVLNTPLFASFRPMLSSMRMNIPDPGAGLATNANSNGSPFVSNVPPAPAASPATMVAPVPPEAKPAPQISASEAREHFLGLRPLVSTSGGGRMDLIERPLSQLQSSAPEGSAAGSAASIEELRTALRQRGGTISAAAVSCLNYAVEGNNRRSRFSALLLARLAMLCKPADERASEEQRALLRSCLNIASAAGGQTDASERALAACTIANGCDSANMSLKKLLWQNGSQSLDSEATPVDVGCSCLHHPRKEVRQMGAALLFNLVIIRHYDGRADVDAESGMELNTQIFCVALEGLHAEEDTVVLERRINILGCLLSYESSATGAETPLQELGEGLGLRAELEAVGEAPTTASTTKELSRKALALLE